MARTAQRSGWTERARRAEHPAAWPPARQGWRCFARAPVERTGLPSPVRRRGQRPQRRDDEIAWRNDYSAFQTVPLPVLRDPIARRRATVSRECDVIMLHSLPAVAIG